MYTDPAFVLVAGATGRQGGAVTRSLLAAGVPVRALVRDPSADRAKAVEALGAELCTGDLDDRDSLIRAARGARAVFSMQIPDMAGRAFEGELAQAVNLIEAAKTAEVTQFVHSSVSGAGQHVEAPGWAEGRWAAMEPYYTVKAGIQDRVREAGFAHWTLIKPGFFMENFLPSMAYLFPRGIDGGLVGLIKPGTHVSLTAIADIGAAVAAAIGAPERFDGIELELASDYLTMTEIAGTLSRATGTAITAPDMTLEEAFAAGMPRMGAALEWTNVVGQPARPEYAERLGITLTSFPAWADRHMRPNDR